jgi:ATP-dependent DNA ligase
MSSRDKIGTLTLTFENDGETVHKVASGFQGADCEKITDFIERALGTVESHERTREYYEDDNRRTEEGIRA